MTCEYQLGFLPWYLTTSRNSYVSPTVRRRPGSVYENGDYYLALPAVVGVIPTRNTTLHNTILGGANGHNEYKEPMGGEAAHGALSDHIGHRRTSVQPFGDA